MPGSNLYETIRPTILSGRCEGQARSVMKGPQDLESLAYPEIGTSQRIEYVRARSLLAFCERTNWIRDVKC